MFVDTAGVENGNGNAHQWDQPSQPRKSYNAALRLSTQGHLLQVVSREPEQEGCFKRIGREEDVDKEQGMPRSLYDNRG